MRNCFLSKGWRCFCSEWKNDKDKIAQIQDEEWERAKKNRLQSEREKEKWKLKKKSETLVRVKNRPFILNCFRHVFGFLYLLSCSKWFSGTEKKRKLIDAGDLRPYRCIEIYVTVWFFIEVVVFFIYSQMEVSCVIENIIVGFLSYRLLDIFQSWVNQFILKSKWEAINVNRSLVLAFTGYFEIIIIGAIVRFTYQPNGSIWNSLYDSVMTMIANPKDIDGSPILYTQIMFAILFITVVVQHVIGRMSDKAR